MWRDGRLAATYKDGRAHLNAYLDDYAFLIAAQLGSCKSSPLEALEFATQLADVLLEQFEIRPRAAFSSPRASMSGSFTARSRARTMRRATPSPPGR